MTNEPVSAATERTMRAYFHTFTPTGVDRIDAILEAIAMAGKAYHSTMQWDEADQYGPAGYWDLIQQRANEAAAAPALPSPEPSKALWWMALTEQEITDALKRATDPTGEELWSDDSLNARWLETIGIPCARAIEEAIAAKSELIAVHSPEHKEECVRLYRTMIDAAPALPSPEPVAWGVFALVDGAWVLQYPVGMDEKDAKQHAAMYEAGTQVQIRPLYATTPSPESALPSPEPAEPKEKAPPHSLPDWGECALRVANSDFIAKRVAEGGYGADHDSKLATELHRFIYEYDDADPYRSAWFLHRLELVLNEARAAAVQPDLHGAILALPLRQLSLDQLGTGPEVVAYTMGHRDARQAAAKFVTSASQASPKATPNLAVEHADFVEWARGMGFDVSRHETLGPEEIGFTNSHTLAAWQGWQRRAYNDKPTPRDREHCKHVPVQQDEEHPAAAPTPAAADLPEARAEHTASADCWCQPEVDYVDPATGATVYVHRERQ